MLLPSTVCRACVSDVTLPPRKRLCIALGLRYEVGESSSAPAARPNRGFRANYRFVGTLDDEIRRDPKRYVSYEITDTWDEMDINEIYVRLDDAQDERLLMRGASTTDKDCRVAGSRPHPTGTTYGDSNTDEDTVDTCDSTPNHDSGTGVRRQAPPARECTYPDFMKCKPLYFKGTEGVIELTQWFERMETVFCISNCPVENQIKFATCTLLGSALTWWNSHVKTVGHDVAHVEMWNLKVKGTDVVSYNQHFQELALMCARMFPEEKQDDNQQQQQNKRQNTGKAYAAGSGEKKPYRGSKPLCSKCNYHHDGQCAPKCHKCNRVGHLAIDYRSTINANTANNQKGTRAGQKPTCYECGAQGHFKRECPKLKNNNHSNQGRNGNTSAKVYAVGHAGTNPDSNFVMGTFLLNNRYASVLFDTGADRSFVSTAFSSQIDIIPSTLDYYYDVELADGRIIRLNAIIRGYTLNFLNYPFNIDLIAIELGSLDVIISMDWLVKYQAIIKYMLKGRPNFLAHVTTKETEDKSEKKRLEDVPIV
ncbi:reverse transcriptase domain-containing protein [Tanacetum coccineum]